MTWVPLRVEPDDEPGGGIVRVDVQVAGHLVDAVLDTGAASSTLPASAGLEDLAVVETRSSGGAFGRHTSDRVTVESVRVGGRDVGPLVVTRDAGDTALLGLDVLARHRLQLDLDGRRLGFDEPEHVGPTHPMDLGRSHHLHVDLHWGEVHGYAVLDTGASVTLVDMGFAERHPHLLTVIKEHSTGTDSGGLQQEGQIHQVDGPRIEELSFAAHTAAVVDLRFINEGAQHPVDLVVGYPLLRQALWTLDYPRRTWSAHLHTTAG